MNVTETNTIVLPLSELHENKGQIAGVPRNPRILKNERYKALLASLKEDNLTGVFPLKIYNNNGEWVVLGGNMRLKAMRDLGMSDAPCIIIPQSTPPEKLRKAVIIDNSTFGEWDMDALADEWDDEALPDWGLDPAELELSDEAEIERKRKEFADRMANGENLDEDEEYQAFKEKFEQKKTTDDCYTPELVYEAVADWVAKEYGLNRKDFVRPFYPGGDYQKEKYPKGCIVVDNPPFSIEAEIVRFYLEKGIRFFLFGPQLTLFSKATENCACIPLGVGITYANGATVSTGFITNLEPEEIRFRSAPDLYKAVRTANEDVLSQIRKRVPTYYYDKHIITTPLLCVLSRNGLDFKVTRAESELIGQLDSQKEAGKAIFGHGYLVSDRVCAERIELERIRVEREKAEAERAEAERLEHERTDLWKLSERELEIIRRLSK